MFPEELKQAIIKEAESYSLQALSQAREELTRQYQGNKEGPTSKSYISTPEKRIAYLLARMPATFAAVQYVLARLKGNLPDVNYESVLDVGAGPGTASWAALELFEGLEKVTWIEKEAPLAALGKKLASSAENSLLKQTEIITADVASMPTLVPHDLILFSYALGEISLNQQPNLIHWLWQNTQKTLIIIEPGSQAGFQNIIRARTLLIAQGASIIAPCPHHLPCPMPSGDWCHFSVRLERSWMHRYIKSGSLAYEDEKFSYVIASKMPKATPNMGRIVRPPEKHSGHICLTVCSPEGTLTKPLISRKESALYKQARKLEWGDLI